MNKKPYLYSKNSGLNSGPITVFAEITRRQFAQLASGNVSLQVPYGTVARHIKGTRQIWFTCDDREIADELEDGLDNSAISWQEESN